MRKKTEIELFGKKYFLFERNAIEYFELVYDDKDKQDKEFYAMFYWASALHGSLKYNYTELPIYKLFKKMYLKKLFSVRSIMSYPSSVFAELVDAYKDFEGLKKKATQEMDIQDE